MQHEEFAERTAEHLEAVADAIEEEDRRIIGCDIVSTRANEMRVAARMVRDMAEVVRRAESGPSGEPRVETHPSKLGNDASILSTL